MPAAAVIPAPIVYIKVVAVKKLVVGPIGERASTPASPRKGGAGNGRPFLRRLPRPLRGAGKEVSRNAGSVPFGGPVRFVEGLL